jgi:predicted MPP superfamily phosphohydrolase
MHFYIYRKLSTFTALATWPTAAVLAFLVVAPLLVALLTHTRLTGVAAPLAWVAYLWMGYAFLFFCTSLALDGYQYAVAALGHLTETDTTTIGFASAQRAVLTAAVIALAATVFGLFSADHVHVVRLRVPTAKLASSAAPLRIVQISDLHLGLLTCTAQVRRLIARIESLHPDIVVSTGDLIDMQLDHVGRFADLFQELQPRLGKFAINGNHEHFAGIGHARAFAARAGFKVLSSTGVTLDGEISIIGIDDPTLSPGKTSPHTDETTLVAHYPQETFLLLLKHQPVVDHGAAQRFDLQLSGHVHGGQIFPFHLLTRLAYRVAPGLTPIGTHAWLYTSRGTGTWGPPIRVFAPAELTVIELLPGSGAPTVEG